MSLRDSQAASGTATPLWDGNAASILYKHFTTQFHLVQWSSGPLVHDVAHRCLTTARVWCYNRPAISVQYWSRSFLYGFASPPIGHDCPRSPG
jgi:hypothetical protein